MKEESRNEMFMRRCLDLATGGLGNVAPNPMVGAVIVYKNQIISESYHMMYGGPHAEVNAIYKVKNQEWLKECILYVNLEPCAHTGKTPPCCDLIIAKGIRKVVTGSADPNPKVAGKGIRKLKEAGIDVVRNVLVDECSELNKRFFTYHLKKRPYIILKWAQSVDGFIDLERKPAENIGIHWISGSASRILVHQWRTQEQAIMTGTNTVITDNPQLTARYWKGNSPIRIIPDRQLRIPADAHIFNGMSPTWIFNSEKEEISGNTEFIRINFDEHPLENILNKLYEKEILSIIVEGGKKLLESVISANLWDEARVFVGRKSFGKGITAPVIPVKSVSEYLIMEDQLIYYINS